MQKTKVGGLFAVNSFGSVVNSETGQFWAASDELNNEFGGMERHKIYQKIFWLDPQLVTHLKKVIQQLG